MKIKDTFDTRKINFFLFLIDAKKILRKEEFLAFNMENNLKNSKGQFLEGMTGLFYAEVHTVYDILKR